MVVGTESIKVAYVLTMIAVTITASFFACEIMYYMDFVNANTACAGTCDTFATEYPCTGRYAPIVMISRTFTKNSTLFGDMPYNIMVIQAVWNFWPWISYAATFYKKQKGPNMGYYAHYPLAVSFIGLAAFPIDESEWCNRLHAIFTTIFVMSLNQVNRGILTGPLPTLITSNAYIWGLVMVIFYTLNYVIAALGETMMIVLLFSSIFIS
eukprot:91615_1